MKKSDKAQAVLWCLILLVLLGGFVYLMVDYTRSKILLAGKSLVLIREERGGWATIGHYQDRKTGKCYRGVPGKGMITQVAEEPCVSP